MAKMSLSVESLGIACTPSIAFICNKRLYTSETLERTWKALLILYYIIQVMLYYIVQAIVYTKSNYPALKQRV